MSIILKLFVLVLLLAVLAAIGFTGYYFYLFQPKKMAFIKEQQDTHNSCLTATDGKYNEFWDRECRGLGYRERCRLPGETVQRLDQTLTDDKNACNTKYTEALKTINYVFPWDRKDNTDTK